VSCPLVAASLCAVLESTSGCAAVEGHRHPDDNVVLITLDTTRADHIGAYGSPSQTPALDRIAREGVVFDQMSAVAPLTLPAHASIFTGRFPARTGVRTNGGYLADGNQTTLAEVLKQHGYATAAFVGSYVLDSIFGLDQGFDTYVDDFDSAATAGFTASSLQRPANEVVDRALDWLRQRTTGPFFMWAHFYDAHAPYDPPEPYRTLFAADPYAGEIAFVDAQVGRLVDSLCESGLIDRTVVVVVGDHGEALGEHGEATHGQSLYESVMHVPFIVRLPGQTRQSRRLGISASAVDVMPTLLEALDIPKPAAVDGRSLMPLLAGRQGVASGIVYGEAPSAGIASSDLRMLRVGSLKLIAASRLELYDLSLDPAEQSNLADRDPDMADRMLRRLHELEQ